ncbi:hypothetical protein LUZ60_003988 [Juncus effusus]|nr:hypothetical protein LUZ60_003988 [Juncus effusus]
MGNLCNGSIKYEDISSSFDSLELRQLNLDDLKTTTNNFNPKLRLGEGSSGVIFKGWIDKTTNLPTKQGKGIPIAIKRYKPEGFRGRDGWQSEMKHASRLRHENIVKLVGYCSGFGEYLLAYEYMHEGSLANHLFNGKEQTISWASRVNIATDVARALTFLHGLEKPVIYRDLKSSHILLNKDLKAKLSDFGLAIEGLNGENSSISVEVLGTSGFCDPYYLRTGHLGVKTDVYGFGVILQELISGERVRKIMKENRQFECKIDSRIEENYNEKEAKDIFNLSLKCMSYDPIERPAMANVLDSLHEIIKIPKITKE